MVAKRDIAKKKNSSLSEKEDKSDMKMLQIQTKLKTNNKYNFKKKCSKSYK